MNRLLKDAAEGPSREIKRILLVQLSRAVVRLRSDSPVDEGSYQKSHEAIINGSDVGEVTAALSGFKIGDTVGISNSATSAKGFPYGVTLEAPITESGPYEREYRRQLAELRALK